MNTVTILRDLWRLRLLVIAVALLALLAGTALVYKISFPPSLESRKYEIGLATARILVDTPSSQVVEVAPKGSESLGVRANLLASLMVDGVVEEAIAKRAGLAADKLVGVTETATEPAPAAKPPSRRAFVLTTRVVANTSGEQLPIIELEAQAPDTGSGRRARRRGGQRPARLPRLPGRAPAGPERRSSPGHRPGRPGGLDCRPRSLQHDRRRGGPLRLRLRVRDDPRSPCAGARLARRERARAGRRRRCGRAQRGCGSGARRARRARRGSGAAPEDGRGSGTPPEDLAAAGSVGSGPAGFAAAGRRLACAAPAATSAAAAFAGEERLR